MLNSLSLMGKLMQSQALLLHLNTFLPAQLTTEGQKHSLLQPAISLHALHNTDHKHEQM